MTAPVQGKIDRLRLKINRPISGAPEHQSLHGKFVKHTTGVDLREFAPFWALLTLLQCSTTAGTAAKAICAHDRKRPYVLCI
jgi:hypothetical protein